MFYPAGDQQLRCREVMDDTRIRFIVNTAALRDYLIGDGVRGVVADSVAFEPAFPEGIYHREAQAARAKRRFFFYARPNNDRNLFLRGVEAVAAAIEQGVLPAQDWTYHFVGKDIPRILLPGGIQPEIAQNLPWTSYAALIRSIDVGLSLDVHPAPELPAARPRRQRRGRGDQPVRAEGLARPLLPQHPLRRAFGRGARGGAGRGDGAGAGRASARGELPRGPHRPGLGGGLCAGARPHPPRSHQPAERCSRTVRLPSATAIRGRRAWPRALPRCPVARRAWPISTSGRIPAPSATAAST